MQEHEHGPVNAPEGMSMLVWSQNGVPKVQDSLAVVVEPVPKILKSSGTLCRPYVRPETAHIAFQITAIFATQIYQEGTITLGDDAR